MIVETMFLLFVLALAAIAAVLVVRHHPRRARREWRGIRRELRSGRVADDPQIADNQDRGRRA